MAFEYNGWAWSLELDRSGAKFVVVALADSANADGYSYPGQKRLAKMTAQSERSVRGHLAWLEEHGYVKRVPRRRKDGTRTSDGYYLPPKDSTGEICRWSTTGKSRQTNRQISPKSPAESAGHESSGEPSGEPSGSPHSPPTPKSDPNRSPTGDALATSASKGEGQANGDGAQAVVDAYNAYRGPLPKAHKLNSARRRKINQLIRELGLDEAIAAMGIAAAEVAQDAFWLKNGFGLDNLLAQQRVIQKAETAANRGTTDRTKSETDRLLAAIGAS